MIDKEEIGIVVRLIEKVIEVIGIVMRENRIVIEVIGIVIEVIGIVRGSWYSNWGNQDSHRVQGTGYRVQRKFRYDVEQRRNGTCR